MEVGNVFTEFFKEIGEVEQVFEVWNVGEGLKRILWTTKDSIRHEVRGHGRAINPFPEHMVKSNHHVIRRNDRWQWQMCFYCVVNNTEEKRNEVRFIKFWLHDGPHQDRIYALGEVGSGSQIAAIEFRDKVYSTPEDLPTAGQTVVADNADELLILDERLNITVIRFHWH